MIHKFLINQFSDVDEVLTDPEISNSRAVHIYKKADFTIIGEFIASLALCPALQGAIEYEQYYQKN